MADFPKIIMPNALAKFPKNRKIKRNKVVNVSVSKTHRINRSFHFFRIEGCPDAFNYTDQPCAYRRTSQNFFQIDFRLLESEISVSLSCG